MLGVPPGTNVMADDLLTTQANALIEAGRILHQLGWVPATSGNLSARIDGGRVAITISGRHKGRLSPADIMQIDLQGKALQPGLTPSAETLLHTQLYQQDARIGAVLHTHSLNATLASRIHKDHIEFSGYELLKAFHDITTHDTSLVLPIFDNDQDIARLSAKVKDFIDQHVGPLHGYLIAGHGLYAWGHNVHSALNYLEAFEFLLSCELKQREIRQ